MLKKNAHDQNEQTVDYKASKPFQFRRVIDVKSRLNHLALSPSEQKFAC